MYRDLDSFPLQSLYILSLKYRCLIVILVQILFTENQNLWIKMKDQPKEAKSGL